MKKAVIYARVSTDIQQKEGTIESQVIELKRQVVAAGDVLVKEYIDNGYSGAKLDRPALDQMRKDLGSGLFDTIYFLNTDRIARDVTFQNIIVTEILRHKKQIIINGKDYIHNPENKFELTVLGAVAELERAKMIERSLRGKQHRLKQGFLLGHGYNIYGYDYSKRASDIPAKLTVNEKEAKIVRYIFENFAKGEASVWQMTRHLEKSGIPTKTGKKLWNIDGLKRMLRNPTYAGTRYFNTRRLTKEHASPLRGLEYGKKVWRPRSEWVGVKVPAIISQKLFNQVQAKTEYNKIHYYHPKTKQLLCNLVECGECNSSYYAYQRYYREKRRGPMRVRHKIAYSCNKRAVDKMHHKDLVKPCRNPEIKAEMLETCVFRMIENVMLNPETLRAHMDFFNKKQRADQLRLEGQLKKIDEKIHAIGEQKKRMVDEYASGDISQEDYIERNITHDRTINKLGTKKKRFSQSHSPTA